MFDVWQLAIDTEQSVHVDAPAKYEPTAQVLQLVALVQVEQFVITFAQSTAVAVELSK